MKHKQGREIDHKYIFLYKNLGETPLEAVERYRKEQISSGLTSYKDLPMTYAGRLDPMAQGEMLVLLGDECKNKEKYLALDKEYEVEILVGISTDTHDILGLIIDSGKKIEAGKDFKDKISSFVGRRIQKYPLFSSKTLGREFSKDDFPEKEIEIYSIDLLESKMISTKDLKEYIEKRINLVNIKYDFRQDKIRQSWSNFFSNNKIGSFPVLRLKVKCSSGTYMRVLAQEMGGLALSIERKKIFLV